MTCIGVAKAHSVALFRSAPYVRFSGIRFSGRWFTSERTNLQGFGPDNGNKPGCAKETTEPAW